MVQRLIACIALFIASTSFAQEYDWKVIRVLDGDTVEVEAPWVPAPIPKKMRIRVLGVDTPESGSRAQCDSEKIAAAKAKEFVVRKIGSAKTITIIPKNWDKYGGRILGDVIIDGESLRTMLISNGYAREYFGEKKLSWC